MATLSTFTFISLDGYYKTNGDDISWHAHGEEENEYAAAMLQQGNILLFGRVTYEMMAGYWPTHFAKQNDPSVADGMNRAEKIVFSKTLKKAGWHNTRIAHNLMDDLKALKKSSGKNLTLLGSGSILTQLAAEDLIDEYQIMIDPVVLGSGTSVFSGIKEDKRLRLTGTKTMKSGVVMLSYTRE